MWDAVVLKVLIPWLVGTKQFEPPTTAFRIEEPLAAMRVCRRSTRSYQRKLEAMFSNPELFSPHWLWPERHCFLNDLLRSRHRVHWYPRGWMQGLKNITLLVVEKEGQTQCDTADEEISWRFLLNVAPWVFVFKQTRKLLPFVAAAVRVCVQTSTVVSKTKTELQSNIAFKF